MITFHVNGESVKAAPQSIEDLITERIGSAQGVAVAIDGAVVPRSQWSREITDGAVIDLLTAVQGG